MANLKPVALSVVLDAAVGSINKKFFEISDADRKGSRTRLAVGKELVELRARIESSQAGQDVNWWDWYRGRFVRGRYDAEKCMALARHRKFPEPEQDVVEEALQIVTAMTTHQRRQFIAQLKELYP